MRWGHLALAKIAFGSDDAVMSPRSDAKAVTERPILFATSGGDEALAARRAAVDLADRTGAALHVVLAWNEGIGWGGLPVSLLEPAAQASLEAEAAAIQTTGTDVAGTHLVHGRTTDEILAVAGNLNAALIVAGAHDRGPLARLFEDSVSEAVVRRSAIPVLVVDGRGRWPPLRVVIAIDASGEARSVAAAGARIAAVLKVPVRLVNVHRAEAQRPAPAILKEIVDQLVLTTGRRPRVVSISGQVVDGVIVAAGRQPALVVAGRRWPGQFDAAHSRRVSSQLLHRYPGPCLFVPRPLSTSVGGASYMDSRAD